MGLIYPPGSNRPQTCEDSIQNTEDLYNPHIFSVKLLAPTAKNETEAHQREQYCGWLGDECGEGIVDVTLGENFITVEIKEGNVASERL